MSGLLSGLLLGDAREQGRRRGGRVGMVAGLVEAGEILVGHVVGQPAWQGTEAIGMVVADERRGRDVPVVMGLADRPSGSVLATILDLRPSESLVVPGRWASDGLAVASGVFVAAEVSSARVEAARERDVAVGLGDHALDRSREDAFRAGAARDAALAQAAEREMLGLYDSDRRHGMSPGEALVASVEQYGAAHPAERSRVVLMAARFLRADVGLPADAPEMVAVEAALRTPLPRKSVPARAREDDSWERVPWRTR